MGQTKSMRKHQISRTLEVNSPESCTSQEIHAVLIRVKEFKVSSLAFKTNEGETKETVRCLTR